MDPVKVIIMGAAGRDFHDFNVYFKDNEAYEVVAFTATQIPDIEERWYPAELSGSLSPVMLVEMLNDLFTRFDELAQQHGVEKIKTIGDCYMAVCGLPNHEATMRRFWPIWPSE